MEATREELRAQAIDSDPSSWRPAELMRRAVSLGAKDDQIDACLSAAETTAALLKLVRSLEPPHPLSVSAADMIMMVMSCYRVCFADSARTQSGRRRNGSTKRLEIRWVCYALYFFSSAQKR